MINLSYPWRSLKVVSGMVDEDDLPAIKPGQWITVKRHKDVKDPTSQYELRNVKVIRLASKKSVVIKRFADYTDPETGSRVAGPEIDPITRYNVMLEVSVSPEEIMWQCMESRGRFYAITSASNNQLCWETYNPEDDAFEQNQMSVGSQFTMNISKVYGRSEALSGGAVDVEVTDITTRPSQRAFIVFRIVDNEEPTD